MATAQEVRPQSIQERIAALNQSHVGRAAPEDSPPREIRPDLPGPRPSMGERYVPLTNGAVPIRDQEILPPPNIRRTGQKSPAPEKRTPLDKPKRPPPLPTRKLSSQQLSPALPPRSSSGSNARRNSGDSSFSSNSISTASTTSRSPSLHSNSTETGAARKLPPAWGETKLPPLPPKRNVNINGDQTTSSRPPVGGVDAVRKVSSSSISSLTRHLPFRSNSSNASDMPSAPPRRCTNENQLDRLPHLPKRNTQPRSPAIEELDPAPQVPQRKLPPTVSAHGLEKIKESSFATLNSHTRNEEPVSNGHHSNGGSPPPVPVSSRPDLSKILATKPRMPQPPTTRTSSAAGCMKCRDFSGPDTHATKFPRESIPQDFAWLANQLTAPFPSLTDKARAIFTWLHHNINYDVDSFFNKCVGPQTPENTLSTGLAVCAGYAGLFELLANHAGLEARTISGHGKGFGYAPLPPGAPIPAFSSNHAWNVVRIDNGHWKLIDSCWGAGNVSGKGQPYNKSFTPEHFIMPNDEFTNRHFPTDRQSFYRDDGRPGISWEEYMSIDPRQPHGVEPPILYTGVDEEHAIGEHTLQPHARKISVYQPGPLLFQFGLLCEHWTLARSNIPAPYLFFLPVHGIDGRKEEYLPFNYVRGTGASGGGDFWYVDVPDPRILGAPGQKLHIYSVTSFADRGDTRGLTGREFLNGKGRVAMGFGGIAEWELV
ncbi:hypothetical protein FQN53_006717 [Emmonsiellopsis sp. PD_33]|nr:hypothetical protein FQN53_006717 [Emmonsiellopsis sp. PD_33]